MNSKAQKLFSQEEWGTLSGKLRLTAEKSPERQHSIACRDLLDPQACEDYLNRLLRVYPSATSMVMASMFAKRYAFLIVAPGLYAMTMYQKSLDMTIDSCFVESKFRDDVWLPHLRLNDMAVTQPAEYGRREWRDKAIENMFAGHLAPIWRVVSKAGNIPRSILWENTAVYVYWLYEKGIEVQTDDEVKLRIRDDFDYLTGEAPAELFGEKENPLKKFNSPKCNVPGSDKQVRVRKTCCYYYTLGDKAEYCSTCPNAKRDGGCK